METTIENAKISSSKLGYEDHGVFTAMIFINGEGWGCGFGGYALDGWDEAEGRRIGTRFGIEFITEVLNTLGVGNWEDLPGTHVRVETEGIGGGIRRIGHIIKDRWFDPKMLADAFCPEEKK